jgi:hypothetical protein
MSILGAARDSTFGSDHRETACTVTSDAAAFVLKSLISGLFEESAIARQRLAQHVSAGAA